MHVCFGLTPGHFLIQDTGKSCAREAVNGGVGGVSESVGTVVVRLKKERGRK